MSMTNISPTPDGFLEQQLRGDGYTLYDVNGNPMAGDLSLSREMKARADELDGYILEVATGQRVYPEED